MPMKAADSTDGPEEIDRWDGGVGWLAHPEETMQRASHLLTSGSDVWLIDPVDAPGVDELIEEFGTVAGVLVTLDRHTRDAAKLAERHDVRVYMPKWVAKGADVPGPVTIFDRKVPGTAIQVVKVLDKPGWHEAALYNPHDGGTLYVSEAVGNNDYMTVAGERLGVHPMLRLFPPTVLGDFEPERIIVGHGRGVPTDATGALRDALSGSRSRLPDLIGKVGRSLLDRI